MQQDGKEIWMVQTKRADFKGLAQNLGVSPVSVRIMRNRGWKRKRQCAGTCTGRRTTCMTAAG